MVEQDFYYQILGKELYPVVPVIVHSTNNAIPIEALIDSGADFCLFNKEVATDLRLQIEDGNKITLNGIGGKITAYLHEVAIQLLDRRILCKALFSNEFNWRANIIGRNSFFDAHEITFKEKEKKVHVKEV